MSTQVITTPYRNDATQFCLEAISLDNFYLTVGNSTDPANSATIDDVVLSDRDSFTNVYRNMIFGKKITSNDAVAIIKNYPYVANTVYTMYDDTIDISNTQYFVSVNASSYYHVFKCLDNNNDTPSTVEPNFSDIVGSNTAIYQTSDGYRWKYMYTFDSATNLKFSTLDYIPLVVNTSVKNTANAGGISIVKVEDGGRGYSNYLNGTMKSADIRVNGNSTLYAVSSGNAISTNGHYTGCLVYITTGAGSGEYKTVTDYIANTTGNFMVLDSQFATTPTNGSQYEITPAITIKGAGSGIVNAVGRALVNALASNAVYRVEMLNFGQNYTYAIANVVANAVVSVTKSANIRPIIPPRGGHGYDAADELGAQNVMISLTFANTEGNTIPATSQYRQLAIIRDPLFKDVTLNLSNITGVFVPGETLLKVGTIRVSGSNVAVVSQNTQVTTALTDWRENLTAGANIVIRDVAGNNYQFTAVANVVNSTVFNTTSNVMFTSNNTIIYLANVLGSAVVVNATANTVNVTNCMPVFDSSSVIIGTSSGAHANVNNVTRGGTTKTFNTFVQLYKYTGSLVHGTFIDNEPVYQGTIDTANATLFSAGTNTGIFTMLTSNQMGSFSVSNTIVGDLSTAVMSVSNKYNPEVIIGSGLPLYIENLNPTQRLVDQNETYQIILNF